MATTESSTKSAVPAFTPEERKLFEQCISAFSISKDSYKNYFLKQDGTIDERIGSGKKQDEAATLQFLYNMQENPLGFYLKEYAQKYGNLELMQRGKAAADKIGGEYLANIKIADGQAAEVKFAADFAKPFLTTTSEWRSVPIDNDGDGIFERSDTGGNSLGLNGQLIESGYAVGEMGLETTGYFAANDHAANNLSKAITQAERISRVSGAKFEEALSIALKQPMTADEINAEKEIALKVASTEQAVSIAKSFVTKSTNESAGLTKQEKAEFDKELVKSNNTVKAAVESLQQRLAKADVNKDGEISRLEFIRATDTEVRTPDFRIAASPEAKVNVK